MKTLEESVIKLSKSEKESLLKSFFLFFLLIEGFLAFLFYHYEHVEQRHLDDKLLLEMKNYSFLLDDPRFDLDIINQKNTKPTQYYELLSNQKELYITLPLPMKPDEQLKVTYPLSAYQAQQQHITHKLIRQFLLFSFIASLLSILFSFYILSPLRNALSLLEIFIKDIIHDLNTPLSAILINIQMMPQESEELQSIKHSAKTISMLHQNLNNYLTTSSSHLEQFDLKELLLEHILFFKTMYDYLHWSVTLNSLTLYTDKSAINRILYNLLSNACKYNTSQGSIVISLEGLSLTIENDSYGIQQPKRIFERFYKESERGIGIGLHIVQKLAKSLQLPLKLTIEKKRVIFQLSFHQLTVN